MITDKDTERGAAGLLDLFHTVDSNTNGAAEAVENEETNGDSNVNVDRNDNDVNNNDDNDEDDDDNDDDESDDEDDDMEEEDVSHVEIDFSAVLGSEERPDAEDDDEGNDDDDNNEETPAYQTQKEIYEEVDLEINVAKKRGKVSIRCAKINALAFTDIIAAGWTKLQKLDLVKTRFAAKEREKRKQEIREEVYDNVMGNAGGEDTNTTLDGFARLGIN